jgi:hypothetical protein
MKPEAIPGPAVAPESGRCKIAWQSVMETSRSKGLMMKRSILPTTLAMPALLYLPFHQVIHAYIDPGTGSLVLQAVIGVLVGAFVAIGLFWNRIKLSVKNLFSRSKKSEGPQD